MSTILSYATLAGPNTLVSGYAVALWLVFSYPTYYTVHHPSQGLTCVHSRTCKQRKLKCDEKKPVCSPCSRASRNCTYAPGAEFRHFGVSRASPPDNSSNPCEETGRYLLEGHVWLDVPCPSTALSMSNFLSIASLTIDSRFCSCSRSVRG